MIRTFLSSSLSLFLLLTAAPLLGCSVKAGGSVDLNSDPGESNPDEAAFPALWASAWCDRAYECDQGNFESSWSSHDDCVADKSGDAQFTSDWQDLICGDFDPAAAEACISAINDGDCGDWADDDWKGECQAVYGR